MSSFTTCESLSSRAELATKASTLFTICSTEGMIKCFILAVHVSAAKHADRQESFVISAVALNCLAYSYASGVVFRTDGAQGVGIVNAMRGATVAIVSHLCFCSPLRPLQCLSPWSAASAATVTAGGIIWVKSASPVQVCTHLTINTLFVRFACFF